MNSKSVKLKVLRVRGNTYIFIANKDCKLIAVKDMPANPNAKQITLEEANEILNLLDIDNTLAYIHFNQLWEKYHEIKNIH